MRDLVGFGRVRRATEDLDEGDDKGQGFARPCGGIYGDVLVRAEERDGGRLDWRAELEAAQGQGIKDRLRERWLQIREPKARQGSVSRTRRDRSSCRHGGTNLLSNPTARDRYLIVIWIGLVRILHYLGRVKHGSSLSSSFYQTCKTNLRGAHHLIKYVMQTKVQEKACYVFFFFLSY